MVLVKPIVKLFIMHLVERGSENKTKKRSCCGNGCHDELEEYKCPFIHVLNTRYCIDAGYVISTKQTHALLP